MTCKIPFGGGESSNVLADFCEGSGRNRKSSASRLLKVKIISWIAAQNDEED